VFGLIHRIYLVLVCSIHSMRTLSWERNFAITVLLDVPARRGGLPLPDAFDNKLSNSFLIKGFELRQAQCNKSFGVKSALLCKDST